MCCLDDRAGSLREVESSAAARLTSPYQLGKMVEVPSLEKLNVPPEISGRFRIDSALSNRQVYSISQKTQAIVASTQYLEVLRWRNIRNVRIAIYPL